MKKSLVFSLVIMLVASVAGIFTTLGLTDVPSTLADDQSASSTPVSNVITDSGDPYFVKYDGVDGESDDANHGKWIDVITIDWGVHRPTAGATGQTRRRGSAIAEDMTLTFYYEKAAPKLLEKCVKGEVIPKLEFEAAATYGDARATYLRYELTNVMITSYQVSGDVESGIPPTVTVGNNFEEIKVTYTEYDSEGSSKGNVETEWKVEKGE